MNISLKKMKFLALTAGVCAVAMSASTQSAQAAESFTADQKKEMEVLFKEYITNNPELILESVRKYQEDQERKVMQSAQENLKEYQSFFAQDDIPMAGNPEGDVTVVEFFDYNCGYCKKAFEDVQKIIAEDKNVRVVFMDMPILSPSSAKMSNISLAAHKQGKYFETHRALMDYRGSQSDEAFYKVASDVGLDMEKLKVDVESPDIQTFITKSKNMAQALGVRGTPGFVIGDKVYPGYIGMDAMRNAIKEARAANAKN